MLRLEFKALKCSDLLLVTNETQASGPCAQWLQSRLPGRGGKATAPRGGPSFHLATLNRRSFVQGPSHSQPDLKRRWRQTDRRGRNPAADSLFQSGFGIRGSEGLNHSVAFQEHPGEAVGFKPQSGAVLEAQSCIL